MVEDVECLERVPWLPLYRVWGQGAYKVGGSPDRRVKSLREVLANLAYKLQRLLMLAQAWLSSWSCGHVTVGFDVVPLCWTWQHYSHGDSSPAVLCDATSFMVFAVVSRFRWGVAPIIGSRPGSLLT